MSMDVKNMNEEYSIFDRIEDIVILIFVIAVILLKLTGLIQISWLWLLSPLWITAGLTIIALIFMLLFAIGINIYDKIKEKKNERN